MRHGCITRKELAAEIQVDVSTLRRYFKQNHKMFLTMGVDVNIARKFTPREADIIRRHYMG